MSIRLKDSIYGNSITATALQTARTIKIGNTGKLVNGSDNVSWTLTEIGAAASNHNHENLITRNSSETGGFDNTKTGFQRPNSIGIPYGLVMNIAHPTHSAGEYSRGLGFQYGDSLDMYTYAYSPDGNKRSEARVYTTAYKPTPADIGALPTSGGTLTGQITVSGESKFHYDTYSDPWVGQTCALKATGHIATTGNLKANGGVLLLGGSSKASWVGFYDTTGNRKGYVGKGSPGKDSLYLSADVDNYILTIGHLCPSANRTYWLGTNSPAQQWKGLCAEGGTIGASDIRLKENIERLDGTIVSYDEITEEVKEYHLKNFKTNARAISGDYYEFVKDRFKPSYYNYKLTEHTNKETGDYVISPEREYDMLKNVGFIAQDYDLENDKVAQEFIFKNEDGSLSYNHMSYVTVGMIALQVALKKIEVLENKINALENK